LYVCSHWYRDSVKTFYRVTIPEAACIQLRRRTHEDEQGNARNMSRILINVLCINK